MALFLAFEVRLKSGEATFAESRRLKPGEAHSAQTLAGWSPAQRSEPRRSKSGEAHSPRRLKSGTALRPSPV